MKGFHQLLAILLVALLAIGGAPARAFALNGGTVTSDPVTVNVIANPDAPLEMDISSPLAGESITAPTGFVGTIDSPLVSSWHIDYRRTGQECQEWITFGEGTGLVANAIFGTLDTTKLINGVYEIQLVVRDVFGAQYAIDSSVVVEGGMKVGHFTVSFADITVPVAGVPMTVTRTYDSRRTCAGDFGYGWTLDLETIRVEKTHPVGQPWNMVITPGNFTEPSTYFMDDAGPHTLTVKMPSGEVLRFQPKVVLVPQDRLAYMLPDGDGDLVGQAFFPIGEGQVIKPYFRALGGTQGATMTARGYRMDNGTTAGPDGPFFTSTPGEGHFGLGTEPDHLLPILLRSYFLPN